MVLEASEHAGMAAWHAWAELLDLWGAGLLGLVLEIDALSHAHLLVKQGCLAVGTQLLPPAFKEGKLRNCGHDTGAAEHKQRPPNPSLMKAAHPQAELRTGSDSMSRHCIETGKNLC